MLINALSEYYDILSRTPKIVSDEFSKIGIHYLISLSEKGDICDIIDYRKKEQRGKKTVFEPRDEVVPKRVEIPGICSNLIEHRPLYIFGLNYDKENDIYTPEDRTKKAEKSHNDFKEKNLKFIEDIDSDVVNAYRNFIINFDPEAECENEHLQLIKKDYNTIKLGFCFNGDLSKLLHTDERVVAKWQKEYKENLSENDVVTGVCSVSGETGAIARVHDTVRGLYASGSKLVAMKESAMSSYGNEQAYNASVSEETMRKYTKALNYLLAERRHRILVDDITILHFAKSTSDIYDDIYGGIFNDSFEEKIDEEGMTSTITDIFSKVKNAVIENGRLENLENLDTDIDFYILGLKPNSSRIAVKFVYKQKFGTLLHNIVRHQVDLALSKDFKPIPFWRIKSELISPVSKNDNINPTLADKMIHSILYDYDYPQMLLSSVIRRIKTDSDTDTNKFIKINPTRMAIIKACINRKLRLSGKKEEITMALNLENHNPAYLCGRLFAVLEDLQNDASGGGLNKTIKDSYFSSACTKPALIFPKLLKLATHHISKATYGSHREYDIGEITSKLSGEFPEILNLTEQGKFILGYYQQKYQRINKDNKEEK